MCNNRFYSDEERELLDTMSVYAKKVLTGKSLEEIAADSQTSVEEVLEVLKGIQEVNPFLFGELKEKLNI